MNTRTALKGLAQMVVVIDSAESVVTALQALRDGTTDEQWDQFMDDELMGPFISACMDLEADLED